MYLIREQQRPIPRHSISKAGRKGGEKEGKGGGGLSSTFSLSPFSCSSKLFSRVKETSRESPGSRRGGFKTAKLIDPEDGAEEKGREGSQLDKLFLFFFPIFLLVKDRLTL